MMPLEEFKQHLQAIASRREHVELQMAVAWAKQALAVHNNDGKAETEVREELHRLLDLQLDNIGALAALKKKAGYLC